MLDLGLLFRWNIHTYPSCDSSVLPSDWTLCIVSIKTSKLRPKHTANEP
jgi:hypothetical protein